MAFRFALVTDVHFGPDARFEGRLRKLSGRAPELLEDVLAAIRREGDVDLIINLGDAIEDESPLADADRIRAFCAKLDAGGIETVHVAGNHDRVHLGESELLSLWRAHGSRGPLRTGLDHVFVRGGLRFVILATHEVKDERVFVEPEQLVWLAAELAVGSEPVVVLMHHPASDQRLLHNRWFHAAPHLALIENRAELRRVLSASGRVRAVFNGHLHWNHFDLCDGIPFITVQSLIENLDADAPGRPARAYAVVTVEDDQLDIEVRGEEPARYQIALGPHS